MVNLKALADFITKHDLWGKSLTELNQGQITMLCEAILDATTGEIDGFTPPYINAQDRLVIPFSAPVKYRWWQGGQSIMETLKEIEATDEVMEAYTPTGFGQGVGKNKDH